jgi:hypothetical protein
MANPNVEITIKAKNEASKALDQVENDLRDLDKAAGDAGKGSQSFGDKFASAMLGVNQTLQVLQAVGQALKQVYETAREGADLLYVEDRFNNLTDSIGTTADVLMDDLRVATRGLKSDAELMAGATDFMALGLANSHDEVVRLTNVAGALGMNMNQLVLTLTNQTTMRFDALGVSVDGFDKKVKALEETGMSAEDAFNEAFLQQAEEQIERVGHAADSAAGAFDRLETSFANQAASFKKNVATMVAPAIEDWADLLERNIGIQDILTDTLDRGIITQGEYADILGKVRNNVLSVEEAIALLEGKTGDHEKAMEFANQDLGYYNDLAERAGVVTGTFTDEMIGLEGITLDADLAMRNYTETLLFKMASEGLSSEAALALAESMGLVDENTMFAATQVDLLRQRYDEGLISAEQYEDAVVALGLEIGKLQDKSVTIDVKLNDPYDIKGWKLQDQSATYTITTVRKGDVPLRDAAGGLIHAASGISMAAPYWVGEVGPEPFFPEQDGRIISNSEAKAALREGGSKTQPITVVINTPMNFADRVWVERELAPYIRDGVQRVMARG